MSRIIEERFPGLLYLEGSSFEDERGKISKPFWNLALEGHRVHEVFYIVSKKDVLRGLHFQVPPHEVGKFIYVSRGKILDVVLDLRKSSGTFGMSTSFELAGGDNRGLFIPPGFAHGYLILEEGSEVHYVQTGKYSGEHDLGIRYDSFGFKWPLTNPILSQKDQNLPSFEDFKSPFN